MTTKITFDQQRTAEIVHRLEYAKLRQAVRLNPNNRAFYAIVEEYMNRTGFDFNGCCGLVTQDRIAAYSAAYQEKKRIKFRSSTY